jgi:hypothetical protein
MTTLAKYDTSKLPSDNELVTSRYMENIAAFKTSPLPANTKQATKLYGPAYFSAIKNKPYIFTKKSYPLIPYANSTGTNTIEIIKKNKKYQSFVWHTTTDKISEAVRWGIVKTYSVTGKAIAALGKYRQIAHERISEGYISNRHKQKLALLDYYQNRLEGLQQLESVVNSGCDTHDVIRALKHYQKSLQNAIADNKKNNQQAELSAFTNTFVGTQFSYKSCFNKMHNGISSRMQEVEEYLKWLQENNMQQATSATGMNSVLTFVKTQMISHLKEMQNLNQNISYSLKLGFAATRGDLNSCVIDALFAINEHQVDFHNPIIDDHHGIYHSENNRVCYDSSLQGLSQEQEKRALLAISFIEKMDVLDTTPEKPILHNNLGITRQNVSIAKATKWAGSDNPFVIAKRSVAFSARLIFGFASVVLAPITWPLKKLGSLLDVQWLSYPLRKLDSLATFDFDYEKPVKLVAHLLQKAARPAHVSLRARVGEFLHVAAENIWDIPRGLGDEGVQISLGLYNDVLNDLSDAYEPMEFSKLKQLINIQIADLEEDKKLRMDKIFGKHKVAEQQSVQQGQQLRLAVPAYLPDTGKKNVLHYAVTRGFNAFGNLFMRDIYEKHPFAGWIFTGAYALGGLSVLFPKAFAFLGPFSEAADKVGHAMAKSGFSTALASGFTLGKIFAGSYEFLLHGRKSWLVTGIKEVEQDPATAIVYTSAAVALGYALAYELDVPILSEHLREDIGTVWPVAAGFAGAKLSLLLFELFHSYDMADIEAEQLANQKIRVELRELYLKANPLEKDDTVIEEKIKQAFSKINKAKIIKGIKEHVKKMQERFEMVEFIEKNYQNLPYLSEKYKHQLVRQFERIFDATQVESLKKALYPVQQHSILRTTMNFIGGYPIAIFRLLAGLVSSLFTLNVQPVKSATSALTKKVGEDVLTVVNSAAQVIKSISSWLRIAGKAILDVPLNSILARSYTILFNKHHLSNLWYSLSARMDRGFEYARQLFKPLDVANHMVTSALPVATCLKTESTYKKLMQKTLIVNVAKKSESGRTSIIEPVSEQQKQVSHNGLTPTQQSTTRFTANNSETEANSDDGNDIASHSWDGSSRTSIAIQHK